MWGSWFKFYLIMQGITEVYCYFYFCSQCMSLITSFLLDEIYLTLEIRVSLNDNFVFLVDCMSNLVTSVSRQQAVDMKLHANETTKKMS